MKSIRIWSLSSACIITILLWCAKPSFAELGRCFYPDGTDANQNSDSYPYYYVPCMNYIGIESMCCASWDHTCTADGFCYNSYQNSLYRDACTDPTWKDPACTKFFMDGVGKNGSVQVTQCADLTYCENANATSAACCANGEGFFRGVNGEEAKINPNSTSTTTIPSTSHAVATSSVPKNQPSPSNSSGLSAGAKAAIGVGVGLGMVIILGIVGGILLFRRKLNRTQSQSDRQSLDLKAPLYTTPTELSSRHIAQLHTNAAPQEMEQPINRKPIGSGHSYNL